MPPSKLRAATTGAAALLSFAATAQQAAPATTPSATASSATAPSATGPSATAPAITALPTIRVRARLLDDARNQLSPDTGSSVYHFDADDIEELPAGGNTPLNQVLLQAPGVVQDSYGQLHVRGDHANLQYRINGVIIPESISGFGQMLDPRIADRIDLITGALPAEYGYRTAGIVDIHTKNGIDDGSGTPRAFGGEIGTSYGSHADRRVNGEIYGSQGALSYYFNGSLGANNLGIENPTDTRNALHDHSDQSNAFGMLSYTPDADSRLSFMFGMADNRYEIPDVPGQQPAYTLAGATPPSSDSLDARQNETTSFQALSYQARPNSQFDYQVSLFHRLSQVHYMPDPVGDLVYNGVAADIKRSNEATGIQADSSYKLNPRHTLRFGLFAQQETYKVNDSAQVFPADDDGNQTSTVPYTIRDNTSGNGTTLGAYVQDEWKATDRLTVNYGVRYDYVDTVTRGQQLSPRLGLTYDLNSRTRLHAGYARYFTPPATEKIDTSSVSKFLGTTNALPSDANTAVLPERSDYFDLGISHQLTPSLTVGLDGYYRRVHSLQDEGQFGNALIYSTFNYDQGRIYGLEGTLNYRHGNLGAYLNVAVSKAMGKGVQTGQFNFDPDELAYISSHWVHLDHDQQLTASGGISYRWRGTLLTADALYGSGLRSGFANSEHLPSYTVVNLGVARSFNNPALGRFNARLSVLNVFDRVYELRDGTGIGVGAPQYGARRTFYLALSKPF